MSKKAANETDVGHLHSALTKVFTAVLKKYERQLEAIDSLPSGSDLEDGMIELLLETADPNPAMLSAVSKFLKDNDIMYDSSEIDELSNQQRRINALREARKGKLVSISDIPAVDNG